MGRGPTNRRADTLSQFPPPLRGREAQPFVLASHQIENVQRSMRQT
jgi:hypothetical protein